MSIGYRSILVVLLAASLAGVLGALLTVRSATLAGPATFYVSPSGGDQNDGTTPTAPFRTIQRAIDLAQPGDVIRLAPGNYYQDVVSKRDGAVGVPITIAGPPDATVRGGGASRIVEIHHDNLTLEGFTIDGLWGAPSSQRGYREKLLYVVGTQSHDGVTGLRVLRMTFKNSGGECLRLRYFAQHNEVANSRFVGCGIHDFKFQAGKRNGEAIYIGTAPEQRNNGVNPTADVDRSNNNWVHHNSFDTQGNECVDIKEGASGNIIEHNICTGQRDPKSAGFDVRGSNNVIRYNESYGNTGAGIRLGGDTPADGVDNAVYSNHFHDNRAGGIKLIRERQASLCGNRVENNRAGKLIGSAPLDPTVSCDDAKHSRHDLFALRSDFQHHPNTVRHGFYNHTSGVSAATAMLLAYFKRRWKNASHGSIAGARTGDGSVGVPEQLQPAPGNGQRGGSWPTRPSIDSRMRSAWPLWRAYSSIMLSRM